ncbi:MAG: hypothetical protein KAU49_00820 [Candidatus Krumholzibacteria bacterium]|nr:hypothetical protein [Candidatus Krumholzibacteria bacterium]
MSGKAKKALIVGAAAVVVIAALVAGKGYISSRAYVRAAGTLSSSLPADLQTKYGEDLRYTVDKFWNCYDEKICSRNDMTDVMDYMKRLTAGGEISDSDIFEFIGFVSRLYTDRLDKHHRKSIRKMEKENQQDQ